MDQGLSEETALSQARNMFLENPIGVSIIGILQGLLWYVLVCVLIRSIEKRPCDLKSFGLSRNGKSLILVILGFLLGLIMYFSYFVVGRVFGQSSFTWSPEKLAILPLVLVSLDMLVNGFGEETAFRAYWQRLLVNRHGLWVGIVLASASFVLLHLLIARFTVIALLASILLAVLYGILYVWTGSIFLVGAMHTTFNLTPRLLGQWPSDIGLVIVNGLALIIVIIAYLRVGRGVRA
jgi:membrane protease YdiL (CAAX protease family)